VEIVLKEESKEKVKCGDFGIRLGEVNGNNINKEDEKLLLNCIDNVEVIEKYLEEYRANHIIMCMISKDKNETRLRFSF
jgi:hypothetical protein